MSTEHLPIVSIFTLTYNHENYISECINSVIAQTYENWEMIIVDDGSTDNTFAVARAFAEKDKRVQVYTQKNIGVFRMKESYDFALEKSKGKYIAILDGDDGWFSEKLTLQVSAMEKNPDAVLAWGKAYRGRLNLEELYDLSPADEQYNQDLFNNTPVGTATSKLLYENFLHAVTLFFRKSTLVEIGGFSQGYDLPLVDLPTLQKTSLKGTFVYIDKPLGVWRNYPSQTTKTYTAQMAEGFYKLSLNLYNENKFRFENLKISEKQIHRYYKKLLVVNYSRSGRYKLIRKEFKEARKDYLKSIFDFGCYEFVWKLRSCVGLLFSFFHADVEMLAKKMGKVSYK